MFALRSSRAVIRSAATLTAALALVAGAGTGLAQAKPPVRPGVVAGLSATVTKPGTAYVVSATWTAADNTSTYQVAVTGNGATLASGSTGTTTWTGSVFSAPGVVSLSVTPYAGARGGAASTITVSLPDLTAPDGSFTSAWEDFDASLTQVSLTDDSGSAVQRMVAWGDGTAPQTWSTGTVLPHTYAATGRYLPTVTLTDAAGNSRVVSTPVIVIGDHTAPTGSFGAAPGSAWTTLTSVQVSQVSVADDYSPAATIARLVDWGDGTAPSAWASGATIDHVYAVAGTFTPVVTLTDESGNAARVATSAVTVAADTTGPVVTATSPAHHRHSVRAWKTLRGSATDAGTGVASVWLRAAEKRATGWYGYRATTRTWVKAATRAAAFHRSVPFALTTDAQHHWTAALAGLRRGTLVVRAGATDVMGNASPTVSKKATLTQR